jgi:tetratricopeptide (TPR) repeat protein
LELKRIVGSGLEAESDRISLAREAVALDVSCFESDLAAGSWSEAVARWQGEFLSGVEDMGREEFRVWLEAEREGLRRGLRLALEQLTEEARRTGRWKQGIVWAERWMELLPLEEDGYRHLIELIHLDGRTAEALARHAAFRSQFRAMDLQPTATFVRLGEVLERTAVGGAGHHIPGSAALFTPDLIGRGPGLAELLAAWERVRGGTSESVLVEGEAGMGKTRLGEEFLRRLEGESHRPFLLRAHSREFSSPAEFGVLGQLASQLTSAPGLAGASAPALAVLASIAPSIKDRFPALPSSDAGPHAVVEALREALAAVAEEEPVLLFIDDLPQADGASRQVVLALIEHPPRGILLVTTARTGDGAVPLVLPSQPGIRRLKLQPLSLAEVELLVSSILELCPEDRRHLAARLHIHGGGNPFYVVEVVSALADEATLVPTEQGAWRLTARDSRLPMPTSVRELVTRRLARLTPPAGIVLEAAAVLGLPFDRDLLAEVVGQSPLAIEAGLEELLLERLIRETGAPGSYEFAHEMVRRHVDQTVPMARGEELSSRAITALESRAGTDRAVTAALAHHRIRASAITAASRRRRWAFTAAAVVALAAGALVVARARSGLPVSSAAVAVLPFGVMGSPELGYLGDGIVTLLSAKLDGVKAVRITDPRAVLGIVAQVGTSAPDVEQGKRVAERVGAGTYVIGDIVEAGDRIRIGAAAYQRGDPPQLLARADVEGTTGQVFQLVDALAGQLLSGLSPGPYEQLTRVAATATGSLPALKAYLEGEALFRGGAFHPAVRAFQRAVTEDTTFALAYYWLSVAAWWADDSKAIDSAAARAVQYGGRSSERNRRLFQAWAAFLQGDALQAERIYRQVVGLEPENVEAWLQLGEVLFHSGPRRGYPMGAARPAFARVLFFEPEHSSALLHLARIAASEGRSADLDSLTRQILTLNADGEWAIEAKALRTFASGDLAEQKRVMADLRTASEGRVWNTARYVAVGAHDLSGARQLVELLTESTRPTEVRAFGYVALAHLELAQGRLRAGNAQLDHAVLLDSVPGLEHRALWATVPFVPASREQLEALRALVRHADSSGSPSNLETSHLANLHDGVHPELLAYLAGGLSVRLGDTAAARASMRQLERPRRTPEVSTVALDAAGSIRAQLAQRAARPGEAIRALEEVLRLEARVGLIGGSPFYSQGLERYRYAGLMESHGRLEDALRWYGSFSSNSIFDFIYLAPSHLRRGRILERLGREKAAAEHYRLALNLYQESDPEFGLLVQEAKSGLARLEARATTSTR